MKLQHIADASVTLSSVADNSDLYKVIPDAKRSIAFLQRAKFTA